MGFFENYLIASICNFFNVYNEKVIYLLVIVNILKSSIYWEWDMLPHEYTHIYIRYMYIYRMVKNLPTRQEAWVQPLGWEDLLEKGMATNFSILTWRIPWTEEPGGLQSMGSQRIGHDWANNTFTFIYIYIYIYIYS